MWVFISCFSLLFFSNAWSWLVRAAGARRTVEPELSEVAVGVVKDSGYRCVRRPRNAAQRQMFEPCQLRHHEHEAHVATPVHTTARQQQQ